ncbi:N-acetylmuramoyl-L-alanine amidase family protein [Acanthopleuribacter pedis]|uniref:N-acetylmuramoyl-L-alanine amidase n=1 Tax=Acanthopleuribacter pedis TaxID=442870 RepID=A0A8J7QB40_9BACT|nr:N-acetylmuramoyl-L-alanine amidase [Acanthopleuribacter pedis]MBO1317606.1 N-acetylmuramoyl-L-alanine amidase [Acanthopleuribacter pedis]
MTARAFFRPVSPKMLFCGWLLLTGLLCLGQKNNNFITLYHGTEAHPIEILRGTRPPYLRLDAVLTSLQLATPILSERTLILNVSQRECRINLDTQDAYYARIKAPFAIQEREGAVFVQALHLTRVLTDLMGVQVIYDRSSKSMHVPLQQDMVATIRTLRRGGQFQISILFNQAVNPPKVEQLQRALLVKIPHSPILFEKENFIANEAVLAMEPFHNLPDGSTELLFKIGPDVTKYEVAPFISKDPRTLITLSGHFRPEVETTADIQHEIQGGIRRIVIDPGHGGIDVGATGPTGLLEKDVVLDLSKRLAEKLKEAGDFEIKLTREEDIFLSLKTRTAIANHFKADLFISVHVNAVRIANARGSETYYLSMDGESNASVDSHNREFGEEEKEQANGEPDPLSDDLTLMLWDMAQTKHTEDSFRLAKHIQDQLNSLAGIRSRGVKQAPLKVLKGALMPAILFEAAFISNPSEERKLRSDSFKNDLATAVTEAVLLYDQDVRARAQKPSESEPFPMNDVVEDQTP